MPFSVYNEKRRDGRNHQQSGEKIIKRRPAKRMKVMAHDIELWSSKVKVAIIMIKKHGAPWFSRPHSLVTRRSVIQRGWSYRNQRVKKR